ncbi:hypothetical protein F3Y22_tig00111772pilonHSYRG00045 [Hibiscus syriacus]|uniref:Pectinesterase inhibitor domain-containing protein n=1 Tax=Hibiscus syriacus TaxID=106335 RepID=A0A6A2XDC5_HIBSY|nr:uncharacterized protein LOC120170108 [Hibiscus syriacus]KAE8673771.1 hypothetical protein F3Y22_tig00111772pilonHSYRG00045 [Hibiscus syriacus]
MNPIANNVALALSFFICLSFFPSLNAVPDITKTCEQTKHKELCIASFKESYIGRYLPDNAQPDLIASIIIKIVVNNASDVSRNLKTTVLEGPVPLTPEVRAKYGICDHEVVSAMKELDKARTAMESRNHKAEKFNMKAAVTNTENCENELKQVEAQLPDKKQFDEVIMLKNLLENVEDIVKTIK